VNLPSEASSPVGMAAVVRDSPTCWTEFVQGSSIEEMIPDAQ
jgi:hypothetical protein